MSDIHLGSRAFNTNNILNKLYGVFRHHPSASNIDLIFLVGDVFDCMQEWPDDNVGSIQIFIGYLLEYCKKYDIVLRVLEGTPSHDRSQSKEFIIINELLGNIADVKYVSVLDIEHIDKYDIEVLYVPDEWKPTTEETQSEVSKLLDERGLTAVHFTLLHGHFPHQVPDLKNIQVHDSVFYSRITKRYVFIGHDHTMVVRDNLIAHGSFDRTAHNQESPKGYFKVISHNDVTLDTVTFIENKLAVPFLTVNVDGMSFDEGKMAINAVVGDLVTAGVKEANIRIKYKKNDLVDAYYNTLVKVYPFIKWDKLYIKDALPIKPTAAVEVYKPVNVTPNNVIGIVKKRLLCSDADDQLITTALKLLNGIRS